MLNFMNCINCNAEQNDTNLLVKLGFSMSNIICQMNTGCELS